MRFRKSIKLAPRVRLNLSRSGVSTSLGGRGATTNIGRKGVRTTVGIPGTGLSFSQRVGGGRRTGGGGASTAGASNAGGCMGTGCLGLFLLVLLGMCMGPDEPSSRSYPASTSSYGTSSTYAGTSGYGTSAYSAAAERETREWFYIHGTLNVRAEPRGSASIVRTLRRGDYVQLGPKDANGWARLYSAGSMEGYVYRASDLVQRQAPVTRSEVRPAYGGGGGSRRSSGSRMYHTGPRGGCYYYNSSGNKQYVDRSYCR